MFVENVSGVNYKYMPSCKRWLICIGTHRASVSATVWRVPDRELFTRRYYTYLGLPQPLQQHDEWQCLYHDAGWVPQLIF